MTENEKEGLARQYAAGEITWRSLREQGFDNYVEVLGSSESLAFARRLHQ